MFDRSRCLAVGVLLVSSQLASATPPWTHGWDTTAESTFADFNSPTLLTAAQAEFVSQKYKVVSLEKCTGVQSGVKTEEAIYTTAMQLKKINPATKVFFYLATDQQGISCYAANDEFKSHPEWWLKDDHGNVVESHGVPLLDCSNAEAAAWWQSIPMRGDNGNGTFRGVPVSSLIDGVLADSAGYERYANGNISTSRLEALEDAKFEMLAGLQRAIGVHGAVVMANGVSMYGPPNEDPRHPNGHNLRVLNFTGAIMNEHTAVFECINSANASFNLDTTARDLDAIETAAAMAGGSKLVFVQTWPGMYVNTAFTPTSKGPAKVYPPVSAGGEPSPQNNDEWRDALREHFGFAHALYLTIAAPNVFWFYGGYWYPSTTGIIACPTDLSSCPAPPEWYPPLNKPLGAPVGPRVEISPYVWKREFAHATVLLDLNRPNASSVTFHPIS